VREDDDGDVSPKRSVARHCLTSVAPGRDADLRDLRALQNVHERDQLLHGQIAIGSADAQQTENSDVIFTLAKQKNKNVLLVFSGSDWCAQCIRFEKKVLSDPSFIQFADSNLILVTADFPQSKKLSEVTMKQNEELASKYNPSGLFPLIVLLRPNQEVAAYLDYHNEASGEFIEMINHYLP
jgi:thiamine biosynthesis lipoprotein